MSTRMRRAYLGSCSNVRSDPRRTSRRSRRSSTSRSPPWTRRSGMPSTSVSPTAHAMATTAPSRSASATRPGTSIAWITAGPPRWRTTCALRRQRVGDVPSPRPTVPAEGRVVPLDDLPAPVAGVREDPRDLEHREPLHQHHEDDDARDQQGDGEPDRQGRHLARPAPVDPGEGGQRVEERRGEDAERVAHHRRPREPGHEAGRVGGGAELHHDEGQREDEARERQRPRGDRREEGGRRPDAHRQGHVGQEGGLEARQDDAEDQRAPGVEERRADRSRDRFPRSPPAPSSLSAALGRLVGRCGLAVVRVDHLGLLLAGDARAYTRGRGSTTGRGSASDRGTGVGPGARAGLSPPAAPAARAPATRDPPLGR